MKKHVGFGICFAILAFVLWKSVVWRISHTYLEDDVAWFFPVIDHLWDAKNSALVILKSFHLPEMTLFDGLYFTFLKFIFGYNLSLHPIPSYLIHLANGLMIYQILSRALNCSLLTSSIASFIYLTFYGHYHAYLWPMAMHHALAVFFMLVFIYEYLRSLPREDMETQERGKKSGLDFRLYGLAFSASFLRLSVLLIPLVIGTHIGLTSRSGSDFYSKIKRWFPVFLLISWYQILVWMIGRHGDIINGLLSMENLILWAGSIIMVWLLFRKNWQGVYYVWLITPILFILCLYLWLFPQDTLTPSQVAVRWQLMFLPVGRGMRFLWIISSLGIMYAFTRHAVSRHKGLGIFIIWYMLLFPYLAFYLRAMPSRYLIYVSPVFSVVLAVSLGEILVHRLKGSYRNISQILIGCVVIGGAIVNIQAIHERSVRSFAVDYHWNYDDIMVAHYIKHDLTAKGIVPGKSILCLQGVDPFWFLEGWSQRYLEGQKMDGYESLRITLGSVLGIRKGNIKVSETCKPGEIAYNFTGHDVLSNFRGHAPLKKEDVWEICGKHFDGRPKSVRVDNILCRQVNLFDDGTTYKSLKQGDWVERYGDYDVYDFHYWYFAVPAGESLNLARFKMGDYSRCFAARSQYLIHQWIDSKSLSHHYSLN